MVTLPLLGAFMSPVQAAEYVVSPNTFLVPGQSADGYRDVGGAFPIGRIYNVKLVAMGGTLTTKQPYYRWKLLNIDGIQVPELHINPTTGVFYGAGPAIEAGSHKVWATVTDAARRTIKFWFPLNLVTCNSTAGPFDAGFAPCPEVAFVPYNTNRTGYFRPGKINTEYNLALGASAGLQPYSFKLVSGSLPKGLVWSSKYGLIRGIPRQSGTFSLGWNLIDSNGESSGVEATLIIKK